jgi:hypothetical protein
MKKELYRPAPSGKAEAKARLASLSRAATRWLNS